MSFIVCKICGNEVEPTTSGNYHCDKCGHYGNNMIEKLAESNNIINKCKESNQQGLMMGWVCPKCGAVMSPYQSHCINCTKVYDVTYTSV